MILVELGLQIRVCNKLYLKLLFGFLSYLITIIFDHMIRSYDQNYLVLRFLFIRSPGLSLMSLPQNVDGSWSEFQI